MWASWLMIVAMSVSNLDAHVIERIDAEVSAGRWVGLSIAVIDGEQTRFHHFGTTHVAEDTPPDPHTLYEIGSITKVYTGIALACAVERGWVALDDPISKHAPVGQVFKSTEVANITLQELATHRSGLPRLPGNLVPSDPLDPYLGYDEADLLDFLRLFGPSAGLTKEFAYSNLGSGLLGYLLGRASGGDYASVLQQCVLDPLQLQDTVLIANPEQQARIATPHSEGEPVKLWSLDILAGAGSLISSIADQARFARAVLEPETTPIADMLRASFALQAGSLEGGNAMGLGWHWQTLGGDDQEQQRMLWHNGGTGGFASALMMLPDEQRAVVVLANSNREVTALARTILLGESPPTPALAIGVDALADYVGHFELFDEFRIMVSVRNEQLLARATGQSTLVLEAVSEDRFRYRGVDAEIAFHRDQSGKVVSLTLHQHGQRVPGRRVDTPVQTRFTPLDLPRSALLEFEGQYQLNEQYEFDVRVSEVDQLTVRLTGQPRFECYLYAEDRCFFEVADAQISFQRDTAGKIKALTLHQGGRDQQAARTGD